MSPEHELIIQHPPNPPESGWTSGVIGMCRCGWLCYVFRGPRAERHARGHFEQHVAESTRHTLNPAYLGRERREWSKKLFAEIDFERARDDTVVLRRELAS